MISNKFRPTNLKKIKLETQHKINSLDREDEQLRVKTAPGTHRGEKKNKFFELKEALDTRRTI